MRRNTYNHTYYLMGTKEIIDEFTKEYFSEKRELLDRLVHINLQIKNLKKSGCTLSKDDYFIQEAKKIKKEIKSLDKKIEENILQAKHIKRVLYSEFGGWYKSYKNK